MEVKRYRIVMIGSSTSDTISHVIINLSKHNYEIEKISSLRLGHSTVVVCSIEAVHDKETILSRLQPIADEHNMQLLVDESTREKFKFIKSDAYIRIRGNQMTGVKAYIISELIDAGLDIHGLDTDTFEKDEGSIFEMNIKGQAAKGLESLSLAADKMAKQKLDMAVANNWHLLV